MSLITDVDYLIHSLRLTYLRHSEDPYAPRIVSLDQNYASNPYIRAAGLADVERWPELTMPTSPQPTYQELPSTQGEVDPDITNGKWPGATGLKYTTTIMGNRSGGAGMRVSGRRTTRGSPFAVASLSESRLKRLRSDSEPTGGSPLIATPIPVQVIPGSPADAGADLARRRSSGGSTITGNNTKSTPSPSSAKSSERKVDAPLPVIFAPRFARAEEMEARRRMRMRARFPSEAGTSKELTPAPVISHAVSPSTPLDEDDSDASEESDDSSDEMNEENRDMRDDEFDGADFLTPGYGQRSMDTLNGSDSISILSAHMGLSMSQQSGYISSPQANNSGKARHRLSPVAEIEKGDANPTTETEKAANRRPSRNDRLKPPGSELTVPGQSTSTSDAADRPHETTAPLRLAPRNRPTIAPKASVSSFRKKPVPSAAYRPGPSALTAKLASQSSGSDNPFTTFYAAISGRNDSFFNLNVYFPHCPTYRSVPLVLKVRQDVSVEEVIGHALWVYWEEKCEPKLDEGLSSDPEDLTRQLRLSSAGWCLRIAEDDGEVDEDYPVVGRTSAISRWNKFGLAVCEATPTQAQQNVQVDSAIVRRPSRIMKNERPRNESSSGGLAVPGVSTSGLSTSHGVNSSVLNGVTPIPIVPGVNGAVFLRVRVASTADAIYYSTTLNVTTDMYMADVLELVCRKRKLATSKEWALLTDDMSILIPLDRTVASLQGQKDLVILKKALVDQLGPGLGKRPGRTADPNVSIFDQDKHNSDAPNGGVDFTSAYKKYTIHRKVPMVFGSHERVLAIDGDYIHIMPSATKALLDSLKTSSYHIKTVVNCILTKKDAASIKLIVRRDDGKKRYDFEADTPELAAEIVATIKGLQKSFQVDRTSTQHKLKGRRPRSSGVIS